MVNLGVMFVKVLAYIIVGLIAAGTCALAVWTCTVGLPVKEKEINRLIEENAGTADISFIDDKENTNDGDNNPVRGVKP